MNTDMSTNENIYYGSPIESKYYKEQISSVLEKLRDYLIADFSIVFEENLSEFVYDAIAVRFRNGKSVPPTLTRDFLYLGASKEFQQRLLALLNVVQKSKDDDLQSIVTKRLRGLSAQDKLDEIIRRREEDETASGVNLTKFYQNALLFSDISCPLTLLEFMDQKFKNLLIDRYKISDYDNNIIATARRIREARNKRIGHAQSVLLEDKSGSRDYLLETFDDCLSLISFFPEDALKEKRTVLETMIQDTRRRVLLPPLTYQDLEDKIPDWNKETFELSRTSQYADTSKGIVYLTSLDEIRYFFSHLSANIEASQKFAVQEKASPVPVQELIRPKKVQEPDSKYPPLPVLEKLSRYHGGLLGDEECREMRANSLIFIDQTAWLNRTGQDFITNAFARMESPWYSARLYLDWPTRVELFQTQQNQSAAPAVRELAKKAHIIYSHLHHERILKYGPRVDQFVSADDYLISVFSSNPEKRFLLFTTDRNIAAKLMERNIQNVLPLMPSVGFIPVVRRNARDLIVPFAIYHYGTEDDEEQEAEENLQESTEESKPAVQVTLPPVLEPQDYRLVMEKIAPVKTDLSSSPSVSASQPSPAMNAEPELQKSAITHERKQMPSSKAPAASEKGKPKLVLDDGKLIPLRSLPSESSLVFIGEEKVMLGRMIAKGGEGTIYEIPTMRDKVAKIYHEKCATVFRRSKISLMLRTKVNNRNLCWPEKPIRNVEGDFVGYVMPRVSPEYKTLGSSILLLGRPAMQKALPGWDRLALTNLCLEIMRVLRSIHSAGILMGDINPMNIMVDPTQPEKPRVMIVDCDSMQIGGYPCPVGMKLYTSPGIYEREGANPHFSDFLRTISDEEFAQASLLFGILLLNTSPFQAKDRSVDDAIRNHFFAFRHDEESGADTPDGYARMIWNNTPRVLKDRFVKTFANAEDVSDGEWIQALISAVRQIERGIFTRDLIPNRYWDTLDHKLMKDFICQECGCETNMPKARYESFTKRNIPLLCPSCQNKMLQLQYQNDPDPVKCEICGKPVTISRYQRILLRQRVRYFHIVCKECERKPHYLTCSSCGKTFKEPNLDRYIRFKNSKFVYCPDCSKKVDVVCSECGRKDQITVAKYQELQRRGRSYVCPDCRKAWR